MIQHIQPKIKNAMPLANIQKFFPHFVRGIIKTFPVSKEDNNLNKGKEKKGR